MATREPLLIGPFAGGLNLYDDDSAIKDNECVEALNFDPGLDGSLKGRPAFQDLKTNMPLGASSQPILLGFYYADNGAYYLLASDGLSSTYSYSSGVWTLITNTFAAAAMTQFDGKAWLVSPIAEVDPGGYWTPAGGFVADANMPHGDVIASYLQRLWVANGKNAVNGTRVYYSKVIGQPSFWASAAFIDVGAGDGQSIVALTVYYNSLVIFRTRSIYSIQYSTDPTTAVVSVLVPGVGLENKHCLVSSENYLYFLYNDQAYQFVNNQVSQINTKVPFSAQVTANVPQPFWVSVFDKRIIFSYYDTMFVYSLFTRTWTRWRTTAFGPIGKLVGPVGPATSGVVYSLPSGTIPAGGIIRRNRSMNPSFQVNTTWWAASTGAGSLVRATSIGGRPHVGQFTSTATGLSIAREENIAVTPGEHLSLSVDVRANSAGPFTGRVSVSFFDATGSLGTATGVQVGSSFIAQVAGTNNSAWTTVTLTDFVVPAGAAYMRVYPGVADCTAVGQIFYVDNLIIESATSFLAYGGTYFDGGFSDTVTLDYGWAGTAGNSESTITTQRIVPLLFSDENSLAVEEDYTAVLRTKTYNFELPGNFKRLFLWGIEAIFQGTVTGEAIPVVQSEVTTWGDLLARGVTWGQLLNGTWGSLLTKSAIETVYDGRILGANRKFVKFRKGLRFRQISFQVSFDTDAKTPLYLFTVAAYVAAKERAVKAIS